MQWKNNAIYTDCYGDDYMAEKGFFLFGFRTKTLIEKG